MFLHTLGTRHSHLPLCHNDSPMYPFCSVERSPAQRICVFLQQPPVQTKTVTTQHQSLERVLHPILEGHCMDDLNLSTKTLTISALGSFLYLELCQSPKRRVALLLQRMLDVMTQPSPLQALCELPLSTPPQLTHKHGAFFVHEHFRKTDFSRSTEGIDHSVSLYTFCPMDAEAPSYAVAVAEVDCLQLESFNSIRSGTTTGATGRVNQANTVRCLISALVYMSAAIKSLAEFTDDHHPVLCTALEYMAKVLTSCILQEKARSTTSISHLRTHFIVLLL